MAPKDERGRRRQAATRQVGGPPRGSGSESVRGRIESAADTTPVKNPAKRASDPSAPVDGSTKRQAKSSLEGAIPENGDAITRNASTANRARKARAAREGREQLEGEAARVCFSQCRCSLRGDGKQGAGDA